MSRSRNIGVLDATSPAPLTSPKSSSLVPTPAGSCALHDIPPWDEQNHHHSQDPLLLHSQHPGITIPQKRSWDTLPGPEDPHQDQSSPPPHAVTNPATSPHAFKTPPRPRSQSVDPLSLFSSHISFRQPPFRLSIGSSDALVADPPTGELLQLSPPKTSSPRLSLSPLTSPLSPPSSPRPPIRRTPLHNTPPHSPTRTGLVGLHETATDGLGPTGAGLQQAAGPSRYSLRHRQAWQLKPYLHDQLQYKLALRSNPDAIVKFRGDQYHTEAEGSGESQELWQMGEGDTGEDSTWEGGRQRHRRDTFCSPSRSSAHDARSLDPGAGPLEPIEYPVALQDLPSTDEEEDRQLRALSKEARKVLRERKAREAKKAKEAREVKAKEKGHRPKSFPLSKRYMEDESSQTRVVGGRRRASSHNVSAPGPQQCQLIKYSTG